MTDAPRNVLNLTADTSAFEAAMAELTQALPDLTERAPEFFLRLDGLLDSGALFLLDGDCLPASGADPLIVRLEPSEGFLRLLAAVRAGQFDLESLDGCFGHDSVSVGSVGATSEGQSAGESQGSLVDSARNAQGRVN